MVPLVGFQYFYWLLVKICLAAGQVDADYQAALVFVLFACGYFNVPIVCALEGLWALWKGQWVIGTRQMAVMWMVFYSIICHWVVLTVWGQSVIRWRTLCLYSPLMHESSCCIFTHLCPIFLSGCLTFTVSAMSAFQPQSSLLRRCFSAIMSTGRSTKLLHWSWAASWAERLAGGLMHTQIKLET